MPVKILIIDDEKDHAFLTKTILEQVDNNYQADFVSDSREGLKKAIEERPHVILCDYRMPDLTGLDVLRELRKAEIDIPFIVVTASGSEKVAVDFMKEGAYDYVVKDVAYGETLQAVIEKSLDKYRMKKDKERLETEVSEAYSKLKETQKELIQSEKLAALGTFSSGIAHEVKNPLAVILGGIEFLELTLSNASGDTKMAMTKIKEATLRADSIIQGLLKFAKPSEAEFTLLKPEDIINETLALMKYRCPLKNIEIKTEFDQDIGINADKNQIQQVLFNILMNAVESMPQGGTITITTGTWINDQNTGQSSCFIKIKDTGQGISQDMLPKLFEPFFTTKRDKKGTGLGLSIAKTILDNHNGNLLIESKISKGTEVRIILPLTRKNKE